MSVEERIQAELSEIERAENVRILYAVESGSRAWGFAADDSDYNVRFIYIRPLSDYVRVDPFRDVIERPNVKYLNFWGWDILKAGASFRTSSPYVLEWLFSPIIYRENGNFAASLRLITQQPASLKRMTFHYLRTTRRSMTRYVIRKRCLYALHSLVCILWIEQKGSPPPTDLNTALQEIELPGDVLTMLQVLIESERQHREIGESEPLLALNQYISDEIKRIQATVADLPNEDMDAGIINQLICEQFGL